MLAIPATLPPNVFLVDLAGASAAAVTYFATWSLFGTPLVTVTVDDPVSDVRNALEAAPETVDFLVSDAMDGFRFIGASLKILEVHDDEAITMMWSVGEADVTPIPVVAAV